MLNEIFKDPAGFTLTELQKKVIQNDIPTEIFEEDMARRRKLGLLYEKYIRCMLRLRSEWERRLISEGILMSDLDDEDFAQIVFAHPDYKNRSQRFSDVL